MADQYLYFGNLLRNERQYRIPNFIGLALEPQHDREMRHDALEPLPFESNSILKAQSQDVFEHLPYDRLPAVLDEVYRVLQPGGIFRLSVPDYRSPLLKRRSVYNSDGHVIGDLMMGAQTFYDPSSATAKVKFRTDGHAHLWFPRYELMLDLIVKSNIRKCDQITFHQGFTGDDRYLANPVPENDMHVIRSLPHDQRSDGKPISLVVDFLK